MLNKIVYVSRVLRINQWIKNTFIFFPLIFSQELYDVDKIIRCSIAFLGFCFISSGMYMLNDLLDIKSDRLHPKKSSRPLTRGPVDKQKIILAIFFILSIGVLICKSLGVGLLNLAVLYIALHILYNFFTKKAVLLDVVFIAIGFEIRIWAGSLAVSVLPSVWIQMCVFLLALFLGFTKRRHEISVLQNKASQHRSVLAHYTTYLLDQLIIICATLTVVFYGLYTISPDIIMRLNNYSMTYSTVFVLYGIFRYLYLVHVKNFGGDPGEVVFLDFPLIINLLLWVLYVVIALYVIG